MNESKPIPEHVFGGYPHNAQTVFAQTDLNTVYAMLADNLKWQLGSRQKATLSLKIDPHTGGGQEDPAPDCAGMECRECDLSHSVAQKELFLHPSAHHRRRSRFPRLVSEVTKI